MQFHGGFETSHVSAENTQARVRIQKRACFFLCTSTGRLSLLCTGELYSGSSLSWIFLRFCIHGSLEERGNKCNSYYYNFIVYATAPRVRSNNEKVKMLYRLYHHSNLMNNAVCIDKTVIEQQCTVLWRYPPQGSQSFQNRVYQMR